VSQKSTIITASCNVQTTTKPKLRQTGVLRPVSIYDCGCWKCVAMDTSGIWRCRSVKSAITISAQTVVDRHGNEIVVLSRDTTTVTPDWLPRLLGPFSVFTLAKTNNQWLVVLVLGFWWSIEIVIVATGLSSVHWYIYIYIYIY